MRRWKMVAMMATLLLGHPMLPAESRADFPPQWPASGQMVWYRLNTGCTDTATSTTCPHAMLYRIPDSNELHGLVSDVKNTLSIWGVISSPVTTLKACASGGTFQCKAASASFQMRIDETGNISSNVPGWPTSFTVTPTDNNGRFGGGVSPSDGIYFSEQWGIPYGSTTMQKLVNWDLEVFAMTDADNDTRLFLAMPIRDAVFPVEIAWGHQSVPLPGPITGYPTTTFPPDLVFGCATNQGLTNPGCLDSKMSRAGFAKVCPAITPTVNWWVDTNSIPTGLGSVAGINGRAVKVTTNAVPDYVGLGPVSTSPQAFRCF